MTFKVVAFLKLPKLPTLSLLFLYSFSPLSISPPTICGLVGCGEVGECRFGADSGYCTVVRAYTEDDCHVACSAVQIIDRKILAACVAVGAQEALCRCALAHSAAGEGVEAVGHALKVVCGELIALLDIHQRVLRSNLNVVVAVPI